MRRTNVVELVAAVALAAPVSASLVGAQTVVPASSCRPVAAPAALGAHLSFMASDLLEGRGVAARGGRLAALYIESVFASAGLEPAFRDGFRQAVPMTVYGPDPAATVAVVGGDTVAIWRPGEDFVGLNFALEAGELVDQPLFIGYGIHSPEYGWDDYGDADVRGRLLIGFVNEPGRDERGLFRGSALTWYGRWTYKYEEAARRGAAGLILIHTDADAGYPWEVVRNSWSGETFRLNDDPLVLPLQLWVCEGRARELVGAAGLSLESLRTLAERPDFRPMPLAVRVAARLRRTTRFVAGANVVGSVPGTDPALAGKAVILSAHYDHLGIGRAVDGDAVYNGAVDNGSALAVLLSLAQGYGRCPAPVTLVFAAVDAEEEGLLGSTHYARHPAVPATDTLAAVNFEMSNVWGAARDVLAIGAESSDLDTLLRSVLALRGMTLTPDAAPEQGFFFRSDQFAFARAGIPSVWLDTGYDVVGHGPAWGRDQRILYRAATYHRPSDEVRSEMDLAGLVQLAEITVDLVEAVARAGLVAWRPDSEFHRP